MAREELDVESELYRQDMDAKVANVTWEITTQYEATQQDKGQTPTICTNLATLTSEVTVMCLCDQGSLLCLCDQVTSQGFPDFTCDVASSS